MDLFGFGTVIVHFLIISHSYHFICKGQINRKELFVFGAYTLLTEIVDLFGNCKKCYTIFMETVYDKAQKLN
ncbi:hypothetical protein OLF77_10290, partial [Streptococcus pneumoniae]|nr:hypothetical protein [Streptococcus pneumoniae]MDG9321871.1 hypothetical protein [Streptococcus pneumoniae]